MQHDLQDEKITISIFSWLDYSCPSTWKLWGRTDTDLILTRLVSVGPTWRLLPLISVELHFPIQDWYTILGILLDPQLLLEDQVENITRRAFAQIHLVCQLCQLLDWEPLFVLSKLFQPSWHAAALEDHSEMVASPVSSARQCWVYITTWSNNPALWSLLATGKFLDAIHIAGDTYKAIHWPRSYLFELFSSSCDFCLPCVISQGRFVSRPFHEALPNTDGIKKAGILCHSACPLKLFWFIQ